MKAQEYIKKYGIAKAKELVSNIVNTISVDGVVCDPCFITDEGEYVSYNDLKRVVDSYDLVAIHGFENSKEIVTNAPSDDHFYSWTLGGSGVRDKTVNIGELRKAILDVESCK